MEKLLGPSSLPSPHRRVVKKEAPGEFIATGRVGHTGLRRSRTSFYNCLKLVPFESLKIDHVQGRHEKGNLRYHAVAASLSRISVKKLSINYLFSCEIYLIFLPDPEAKQALNPNPNVETRLQINPSERGVQGLKGTKVERGLPKQKSISSSIQLCLLKLEQTCSRKE